MMDGITHTYMLGLRWAMFVIIRSIQIQIMIFVVNQLSNNKLKWNLTSKCQLFSLRIMYLNDVGKISTLFVYIEWRVDQQTLQHIICIWNEWYVLHFEAADVFLYYNHPWFNHSIQHTEWLGMILVTQAKRTGFTNITIITLNQISCKEMERIFSANYNPMTFSK